MDPIKDVLSSSVMSTAASSAGMARAADMLKRPDALIGGGGAQGPEKFSNILSSAIESVHQAQTEAKVVQRAYQAGDPEVGLEQTMIAMNKASLSFQMLTQARNRVATAYNEIMNMPV